MEMKFQTLYNMEDFAYPGEHNNGEEFTVPNDAMSPADILARFVRDMPVPQSRQATGTLNDDFDSDAWPMQGQEFDPLEELDKQMRQKELDEQKRQNAEQ